MDINRFHIAQLNTYSLIFANLAYIIRHLVDFFAEVPGFGWGAEPSIWINRREVPRNALVDLIQ